jgi:hypothetical protein
MALIKEPNITQADQFYAELIDAQRDMTEPQADMMLAKLVLILSNHIGDRSILTEALHIARNNTIENHTHYAK